MILSCPTPTILCSSTSQTTDLKSADAASEDLGGARTLLFFLLKNCYCIFPLPFNHLILPPPCNHHNLVHESFFLFPDHATRPPMGHALSRKALRNCQRELFKTQIMSVSCLKPSHGFPLQLEYNPISYCAINTHHDLAHISAYISGCISTHFLPCPLSSSHPTLTCASQIRHPYHSTFSF